MAGARPFLRALGSGLRGFLELMAIPAGRRRIMRGFVLVAAQTGLSLRHLPFMRGMARRAGCG